MSDVKTERQLNLLFVLLNARFPIEREEIRKRVPGYFDKSNEAFERMFERDKEDLRDLGIPIEALSTDVFHEDNFGYLINTNDWLMPEIQLSDEERVLLNIAASAWTGTQNTGREVANSLNEAVQKLTIREVLPTKLDFDLARQTSFLTVITQAKSQSKCVEFVYFNPNSDQESHRLVAPWRIFLSRGQGYLIGFDQNKGEERIFKLSRIVSQVSISSQEILENAPSDLNISKLLDTWEKHEPALSKVVLKVSKEKAGELRLISDSINYGDIVDELEFHQVSLDLISKEIMRNCDEVEVVEPLELRTLISHKLGSSGDNEK